MSLIRNLKLVVCPAQGGAGEEAPLVSGGVEGSPAAGGIELAANTSYPPAVGMLLPAPGFRIHTGATGAGYPRGPMTGGLSTGTPGGIREPAKLAMACQAKLGRNPRPSGSKTEGL